MFKTIFGFLGLLIALAIVVPLAKPHLADFAELWHSGQATTRVRGPSASAADKPTAAQPASDAQTSGFGRTYDALQNGDQRYKRAEERSGL